MSPHLHGGMHATEAEPTFSYDCRKEMLAHIGVPSGASSEIEISIESLSDLDTNPGRSREEWSSVALSCHPSPGFGLGSRRAVFGLSK